MSLTISSSFDAGNIHVVRQDDDERRCRDRQDHMSDFYQWFYFRVAGGAGREITLGSPIARARPIRMAGPITKGL